MGPPSRPPTLRSVSSYVPKRIPRGTVLGTVPLALPVFVLGAVLGIGAAVAQQWQPPIRTVSQVFVRLALIGVRPDGSEQLLSSTVEASPDHPGSAVFPIDFRTPAGDHVTELRVSLEGSSSGGTMHLSITTVVQAAMPRQEPVSISRTREAQVSSGGTFLHQVYESPDHESSLVLTLSPESRDVPMFIRPTAGAPILFRVVMSRITEKGAIDLENNILRTLGDNPVSYSFKTTPGQPAADAAIPEKGAVPAPEIEPSRAASGRAAHAKHRGDTPPSEEVQHDAGSGASSSDVEQGEEIELTLVSKRNSDDILVVDATLKRRVGEAEGTQTDRSEIVRKTAVLSRGGVMEILVGGAGELNLGAYRFRILADF